MIKPDTLIAVIFVAQAVFAICLGLSKLRLILACPLAAAAMFVALVYAIQVWGNPEIGGIVPVIGRRLYSVHRSTSEAARHAFAERPERPEMRHPPNHVPQRIQFSPHSFAEPLAPFSETSCLA